MEKEIENIIRDNEFSELSVRAKFALQDWVNSEEEFDVLKQILSTALTLNEEIAPSPKQRSSLTDTFRAHHAVAQTQTNSSGSVKSQVIWMRVVISVAAIFILFILLFPFNTENNQDNLIVENKTTVIRKNKPKLEKGTTKSINKETEVPKISNVQEPIIGIRESQNKLARLDSDKRSSARQFAPGYSEDSSFSRENFDMLHSDHLNIRDLPADSRQVIRDNPALLDILYTAF